jgi:hypothetical protein
MTTAAERIASIDNLPAPELCLVTLDTLEQLVGILNQETTLLRAGKARDAATLTPQKTELAQSYMGYARAVQRQQQRLSVAAPRELALLKGAHERLATQMADNLRVIATARKVTEDLLTDVAVAVAATERPRTYGPAGTMPPVPTAPAKGLSINRSL